VKAHEPQVVALVLRVERRLEGVRGRTHRKEKDDGRRSARDKRHLGLATEAQEPDETVDELRLVLPHRHPALPAEPVYLPREELVEECAAFVPRRQHLIRDVRTVAAQAVLVFAYVAPRAVAQPGEAVVPGVAHVDHHVVCPVELGLRHAQPMRIEHHLDMNAAHVRECAKQRSRGAIDVSGRDLRHLVEDVEGVRPVGEQHHLPGRVEHAGAGRRDLIPDGERLRR
jgi:hypothetical protein